MANICINHLYAYSEDKENFKTIKDYFKCWENADLEENDNNVNCYFESKWTFPKDEMNDLYNKIPNKEDIYMRCLSVEYGNLYHALWTCNGYGWKEV